MRKSSWEKTQEELLKERAEVLGRAGEALATALSDLDKIGRSISESIRKAGEYPGSETLTEINGEIRHYNRAREYAQLRYYYLIVTREAMGFRRHKAVEEAYKIPPKKKYL
ncbi:MAG: hypothetical protein ACM33C_08445 [Syntrophaceae bacterium]|jgi:hypothetical protein